LAGSAIAEPFLMRERTKQKAKNGSTSFRVIDPQVSLSPDNHQQAVEHTIQYENMIGCDIAARRAIRKLLPNDWGAERKE